MRATIHRNRFSFVHLWTLALALATAFYVAGCAAPRAGYLSPGTVGKGHVAVSGHMPINLPTQTSASLYGGLEEGVKTLVAQDTAAIAARDLNDMIEALYAYSLDPLGGGMDLGLRYGVMQNFDLGYAYASGAHALSAQWQFLGPSATDAAVEYSVSAWQGSFTLQYSWQDYDLPSVAYLDKLQSLLRYEFKRSDLYLPLVFGRALGDRGRFGSLAFGPALNYTWITYGSDLLQVVEKLDDGSTRPFANLQGEKTFASYGGFVNARLGYRYVFVVLACAAFYQDYGEWPLFSGNVGGETTHLKGMTFIPSAGLELRF